MGVLELNPGWPEDAVIERAKRRFWQHRTNARNRGIEFFLTFEEWYGWWQATGHWGERGRHRESYVMARIGDEGAYELGNIECITARRNCIEGNNRRVRRCTPR